MAQWNLKADLLKQNFPKVAKMRRRVRLPDFCYPVLIDIAVDPALNAMEWKALVR